MKQSCTVWGMLIKGSKRIGAYRSMKTHPISVEFVYKSDAEYLLTNKRYLPQGVFVDKEYCHETEECRKILRLYLKAARKLPLYHKKCRLDKDTLILRGVSYTKNDLSCLPAELSGFNISSKSDDDNFGFFGSMNPLSNFHLSNFLIHGKAFHCAEQYIQHTKLMYFKDADIANQIMSAKSGLECMQLAQNIAGYDHEHWKHVVKEQCIDGINAKFPQNPLLQKMLLETGNKVIIECCRDVIWGNGVPLHDENDLINCCG